MTASPTKTLGRRVVEQSRVIEFCDATDPDLLRALADWLERRSTCHLYGLSLTLDYDGDGCDHILHAIVDGGTEELCVDALDLAGAEGGDPE